MALPCRNLALRLAAEVHVVDVVDVVDDNFMPGTLQKWGLGYEELKKANLDLILVRVSAYAQYGPYVDRLGLARVAHGFAGLFYLAGEPGGRPVTPGSTSFGDYITGMYAVTGALMSLFARNRHGIGHVVDVGLYEGVFRMLDEIAPVYASTGFVRERMGADTVNMTPHSQYETADGRRVALACTTDAVWLRMARAMGREDLATKATYGPAARRIPHATRSTVSWRPLSAR